MDTLHTGILFHIQQTGITKVSIEAVFKTGFNNRIKVARAGSISRVIKVKLRGSLRHYKSFSKAKEVPPAKAIPLL